MTFGTYRHPCKIQSCVFDLTSSILSKFLSLFLGDQNKLVKTQTSYQKFFNIVRLAYADLGVPPRVYINKDMQDIISAIIYAKLAVAKSPCKCFFKAAFLTFIRVITIWLIITLISNACKDYFTIAKVKKSNRISFAISFFKNTSASASNNKSVNWIMKVWFFVYRTNLRYSYIRVLVIWGLL